MRTPRQLRIVITGLLALVSASAFGQGLYQAPPGPPPTPTASPPGGPSDLRLRLIKHRVEAEVDGASADYRVRQTFHNPTDETLTATYLFPVPADSIARGVRLRVDDRELKGEVLDASQALAVFHEIVYEARDPALLEYAGSGMLRATISPVPADSTVEIVLEFTSACERTGEFDVLTLPLRPAFDAAAPVEVAVDLRSDEPLATIYSPTHLVRVTRDGDRAARVTFDGRIGRRSDLALYYTRRQGPLSISLLTHRSPPEDGTFVLLISPRVEIPAETAAPRDVVFVLDRSGSMEGRKWTQAVSALRYGIGTLHDQDRFGLVSFATDVREFDRQGLVAAGDAERRSAIAHLESLRPAGGTNMSGALARAIQSMAAEKDRLQMLVFLTDGLPTIGEIDPERILEATARTNPNSRLFAFGIGYDVNTYLLDRLAADNRGDSDYVGDDIDLKVPVSAFFAKVAEPTLVAPQLSVDGLEIHDVYPPELPDVFAGSTLVVTGRYHGSGTHLVTLSGHRGDETLSFTAPLDFPAESKDQDAIATVWAARKIGFLLNQIRLHGAAAELTGEVVELGRRYGVVTPYTSALAMDDRPRATSTPAPAKPARRPPVVRLRGGSGSSTPTRDAFASRERDVGPEAVSVARSIKRLASTTAVDDGSGQDSQRIDSDWIQAGDRGFRRCGDVWVDADLPAERIGEATEVRAFSDTWFRLLAAETELAHAFAVAPEIVLVQAGRVYRVVNHG